MVYLYLRTKILWLLKPIQIFMQWLGRETNSEPRMTKEKVDAVMLLAKPGMPIGSHEDNRITNASIPGYWDHLAIISRHGYVIEAVGDEYVNGINIGGVREVDLEEWLFKKDDVLLLDVLNSTQEQKSLAASNSFTYKGMGYNYGFNPFDKTKMFCSGLVWNCWRIEKPDFLKQVIDRKKTITPNDFYEAAQSLNQLAVLYDSRHTI